MAELIQICAWCLPRTVRVLGALCLGAGETLELEYDERQGLQMSIVNAAGSRRFFSISHGICPECSKAVRAEGSILQ